jgi:hypothetical protein
MEFNDVCLDEIILIDDSGKQEVHDEIRQYFELFDFHIPVRLFFNRTNQGQIPSIDWAYSKVKTPFIFHLENDWEFYKSGFMSASLQILEEFPKILQVWLRGLQDTNTHPVEPTVYNLKNINYRYMATGALGGSWHGFSWNPGLRRLADYQLVAPFTGFIQPGDFNALTECRIGQAYYQKGFRAVTLLDKYCKHIG